MVHLLAAALWAAHLVRLLCRDVFGDVLHALEIFPAFLTAIFVDRHGFLLAMGLRGTSRSLKCSLPRGLLRSLASVRIPRPGALSSRRPLRPAPSHRGGLCWGIEPTMKINQ